MHRRLKLAVVALAALTTLPYVPVHAVDATSVVPTTYYLHAATPAGNAHELTEFVGLADGPSMDATAPGEGTPKTTQTTSGNNNFRKNFLLAYWGGDVHGEVVDPVVTLYLQPNAGGNVEVSLFGDGVIGTSAPFARKAISVPAGPARVVTFDMTGARGMVDREMVLSVYAAAQGVAVLYDAASHASRVSFGLGPYVPPPSPSWPPAAGYEPPALASRTLAHRETSIALSPTDPDLIALCTPSGVPNTGYGSSYFHVSRDGGATWAPMQVEGDATDPRNYAFEGGDCDVAFDAGGTMYSADTWLGSLSVGHSFDGGLTWTGTPIAASAPIVDRPWLVGGPDGTIHVTYQDVQFGMPSAIWYTRSTDHGVTFLPAVSVTTANHEGAFTWEGNPVVSPDGQDIFLVYTRRAGPAIGSLEDTGPESVWVAASHDGGLTWTQNLVARMPNPASFLYPSIGMDAAGWLHVVFASRTTTDHPVWYSFSKDGASWSAPVKLLAGVGAYSPWIVGAGPGAAAFHFYASTTPVAAPTKTADWYFYAGRVSGADTGSPTITAGPTTTTPIFTGRQSETPEFNQLRLDADGKIHIGASAYQSSGSGAGWAIFYQREA